ncbi:RNA polymerase sigma factor [Lewinella cohaerens]|uniref:RNA polymerase sigma factor n=1 Tax=Lewinella cohaerens TaxID=70995 RepID=UPI000363C2B9|nr:sigma-70 family RNA polymerase sigma factor [Lewinella cohaerens]
MSETDRQWQLLRTGDQKALAYLFKHYYRDLYQYAFTMLSDHAVVQDQLQKCFLKLWEKRATLPLSVKVKPYLFQTLRFGIIDYLRQSKAHSQHLLNLQIVQSRSPDEYEQERKTQTEEKLQAAIQQLSPVQKEIIYLRFYNKVAYTEIAGIMGMKYQSVRNSAYRALKKLRIQLLPEK